MADLSRIESRPEVCSGKPVIRGTRVMVRNVLSLLRAGKSVDGVLASYPSLQREDVDAAMDFAMELVDEVRLVTSAA